MRHYKAEVAQVALKNIEGVKERIQFTTRLMLAVVAIFMVVAGGVVARFGAENFDLLFWFGLASTVVLVFLGMRLFRKTENAIEQLEEK